MRLLNVLSCLYVVTSFLSALALELETEVRKDKVYLTPKDLHFQTLIYLHGVGESPKSLFPTFTGQNTPLPRYTKVILLAAYVDEIDRFNGATLTSWFNFRSLHFHEGDYNTIDLEASARRVYALIEEEAKLLNGNYSNIFVGGFSQGGSLALHVGFNCKDSIGGVFALSSILLPYSVTKANAKAKERLPIFVGYGDEDERAPIQRARESYTPIAHLSHFEFHEYAMDHSVSSIALRDVKVFIERLTKRNRLKYFNIFYY